jgi:hypothetical protein
MAAVHGSVRDIGAGGRYAEVEVKAIVYAEVTDAAADAGRTALNGHGPARVEVSERTKGDGRETVTPRPRLNDGAEAVVKSDPIDACPRQIERDLGL